MDHPIPAADGAAPRPGHALVVSSVRWGYLWQRHQALASAAAEAGWRIDFLEPHPRSVRQVAAFLLGRLRGRRPTSNPTQPPSGVRVLPVAAWLRPGRRDYDLTVCYVPDAWSVRRARTSAGAVVYDAVLDWATVPASWYPPLGWRRAERRLAALATAVTTDSSGTQRVLAARGIRAEVVHPAADEPFLADDLPDPEPGTAVYFGAVRDEVDHEVLLALAADGVAVDVWGPVERPETAAALTAGGVRLHDPVPVGELARVVARHQLVLLPYRGARGGTLMPAKFWNCIAVGRWVLVSGIDVPVTAAALLTLPSEPRAWIEAARSVRDAATPPGVETVPTWADRWGQLTASARSAP